MICWNDRLLLFLHVGRQILKLTVLSLRLRRIVRRWRKEQAAWDSCRLPGLPYRQACELLLFSIRVGRLDVVQRRQRRNFTNMFRWLDRYCRRSRPRYLRLRSEPARRLQQALMVETFRDAMGVSLSARSRARLASFPLVSLALRNVLHWCGAADRLCCRERLSHSIDFCAVDLESAAEIGELSGYAQQAEASLLQRKWRGFARWSSSLERTLGLNELDRLTDSMILDLAIDALAAIGPQSGQCSDGQSDVQAAAQAVLQQIEGWL